MKSINKKVISLSQLKELIEELYDAKQEFDSKCKKNKMPRESMEQFMFSFFKHKFGLNAIVVEWVYGVIEAIKMYHKRDNDVALFALILRNEVDEEFADIQKQIKLTINDILMNLIETQNPNKGKREINNMFSSKAKGRINENMALEIINTMYTDEHPNKEEILEKLMARIKHDEEKIAKGTLSISKSMATLRTKSKLNSKRIRSIQYLALVKIILDMQLKTHYGFLSNLSKEFKKLDTQNYGFISLDQFQELVHTFTPDLSGESSIAELMQGRDDYDPNSLTFSDVVILFSAKHVETNDEKITMLQYIFEMADAVGSANGHYD